MERYFIRNRAYLLRQAIGPVVRNCGDSDRLSPSRMQSEKTPSVKAVTKTTRILELLAERDGVGVTEIALHTAMAKATVYRFLATLQQLGYIRQDSATERYSLTLKLFELGALVRSRRSLVDEAYPTLQAVAAETGETVHLAMLEAGHLVYVAKIESRRTLKVSMQSRVGSAAPVYCTGLGKAMLAGLAPDQVERILARTELVAHTPNTLTDPASIERELATIRAQGYAVDNEEHERGVTCIAAPVADRSGTVVAAVSVSVPSIRMTAEAFERYRSEVVAAAGTLSTAMTHHRAELQP